MASSMIYSSSLLVIITTGSVEFISFRAESVSKPESPGIFSSKKTISNLFSVESSIASVPLLQEVTT